MQSTRSGPLIALMAAAAFVAAFVPPSATAQTNDQVLTGAYNASGQALFRQFSAAPGNIVFSPYSIGTAMAMALAGARGDTEREMATVLAHRLARPGIDAANGRVLAVLNGYDKSAAPPTCHPGMQLRGERCEAPQNANGQCPILARPEGQLCVATPIRPPSAKLLAANALMLAGASVANDYKALLKDKYAAEVFERARLEDVNGWVGRKTEGKIPKILDRMSDLVLVNAVYFKARWAIVFDQKQTKDEPFQLSRSRQVPVPMMQQRSNHAVAAREGYRAIRLPYQVRALGMVVVVPNEVDGLGEVARRLDAKEVTQLMTTLRAEAPKPVVLAMPRFKSEFSADLKEPFKQAGMTRAFDARQADFSGMTGRPAAEAPTAIDQIVHRAVIEVSEESTEAAAATAVGIMVASAPPRVDPVPFRVDRPFLYFIVDEATGAILFQGRVIDPR